MWSRLRPNPGNLRWWQAGVLLAVFGVWHLLTAPGLIPPLLFDNDRQAAFFFGEPLKILARIWNWFAITRDIYGHLAVTLVETVLAFGIGTVLGLALGLWLALSPLAAAILDPYIKALNSMPRVILAPIFAVWFGLGVASKVALGVTLVFFIVFFNVYQGVTRGCSAQTAASYCVTCTCPVPRVGCSARCTHRLAWRSSVPWSANTSAALGAWAT
jgi:NitT/TauT family transport system permease protein